MSQVVIRRGEGNCFGIIDGNWDFIDPKGALYVAGVEGEVTNEDIIKRIDGFYAYPFDYTFVTEDEHPLENHVEYGIYGKHCVHGSDGQKYPPGFLMDWYYDADERLSKGMNPYIIAYSVATSPQFASHIQKLRELGIKRVFLTGWAFTHCVGESAIAYAIQGFEVHVVRDATRSVPPPYGDPEVMEQKLALYGVKLINAGEILAG